MTLRESNYPPVHYIPRKDVDMSLLDRTDHGTYCLYRVTVLTSASLLAEVADPYVSVDLIQDRLAFNPGGVDAIKQRPEG